ncbi:MAG: molybdopterin-dependent oxidoreductase [Phycisphaerae bacterium]
MMTRRSAQSALGNPQSAIRVPKSADWLDLDRRQFIAALAAAYGSSACAWAAPRSRFIDYAGQGGTVERFVNALCPMCPGGCGLNLRVVHGCAVGVRGNKLHPVNRGGLCSRASAVLQDIYNPDRLRKPLKRNGPRGSNRWQEIEWDEAIGMIADRLQTLREKSGPQGLCVVLGRDRGITRTAWRRFMRAYGSPNLVDGHSADNLGVLSAVLATHGIRERLGYDIARASFVLSFTSEWLDAHWSTEQAARGFADFRRGRPGFRPRWIHAGPRYSVTAAKADEWLPLRPGTEGTVALGVAHVIFREGLHDREFVGRHGYGLDDWTDEAGVRHEGFRRMVLRRFTPAKVHAVTGVSEGDLFRIGREFGTARPAVALGYDGGGPGVQATYDRMAIHCLNALVGSIDVPGGVTVFRELSLLEDDCEIDDVASRGLAQARVDGPVTRRRLSDTAVDLLAESIATGRPYATEAMILSDSDPVFSLAEGPRLGAALSAVPFVAAITAYHNDTSRFADVLLPSLHGLHRWNYTVAHTLTGHPVVTISHPALPPLPGERDAYDVIRAIGSRFGGTIAAALPWTNGKAVVDAVCRELFRSGKGVPFSPADEEAWVQLLERRGWRAPPAKNYEDFKREVLAGGGWTAPIYSHGEWDRVFQSPPGKFAFSSALLAKSFKDNPEPGNPAQLDRRCLPDCRTEPRSHDATYPLDLYVYALPNLVSVASPNLPWLNTIAGAYMFEKWRTWVEIHPETAEKYGIHDGDVVLVRTARGELRLPAKRYAGLMPDVIAIPYGYGHKGGGRWSKGIGENPAELLDTQTDPLTGTSLWSQTQALIEKT